MKFTVLTLFPELVLPYTQEALLGKAAQQGILEFAVINMRDFSGNKHGKVDDTPYGGGAGMVIRVDVVEQTLHSVLPAQKVVMLTPAGKPFDQKTAEEWAKTEHLILLCGRYEGFDARAETLVTDEVSIGDFVMMGGEAAAVCIMEAVGRLVDGVIGDKASHQQDSFSSGLLDFPEYTRPETWQGIPVPDVLTSGHHGKIERWRRDQALKRTLHRRPELLAQTALDAADSTALLDLGVSSADLQAWGAVLPKAKRVRSKRKAES